ncbi:hypothetical protein HPB49_001293 [Dermacentor silvarum]|uniref:Uncharacterized protein n=1 Tax=Dermacentor silvarum TaxID=543639 RepID=A0ACB8C6W1_DERSI|nr:hypothetical protein HPB49_001293 [Dermacentor silvarum]
MRFLWQLCGVMWLTSLLIFGIVLLPALLVSRKLRELFFVTSFRVGAFIYADGMASARRAALKPLESLVSRDPALKKENALRVLEIGAGTGANFEHVTRKIRYTNVDPNPEFGNVFLRELNNYPKIEMERWVQCHGENMDELENGEFDVVLFTYLLCSVQDGRKVLEEAKRVLVKVLAVQKDPNTVTQAPTLLFAALCFSFGLGYNARSVIAISIVIAHRRTLDFLGACRLSKRDVAKALSKPYNSTVEDHMWELSSSKGLR